MLIQPSRRRFLFGAAALITAPSIVRAQSLMPVSVVSMAAPTETSACSEVFATQYREEFIAGFEWHMSLLRKAITTESELPGTSPWLVAEQSK